MPLAQSLYATLTNFEHMLRALRYRNYRLFFAGQGLSLVGTWIQQVALGWLVYKLTGSPFLLGVVGFSSMVPSFFVTPFAGVMVDRWRRHRILLVTQILEMLQAFVLAFLVVSGAIQLWHIILLSLFLGVVTAFDAPARQSFVVEIIEKKEHLGNAIALNSFMFNGARLLGPMIAGILIVLLGEGPCFIINGLSFLFVIWALMAMDIPAEQIKRKKEHIFKELRDGISYAWASLPIRNILLLLGLLSFVGMPFAVLLPIFAGQILHGGADTFGFLMAGSGLGALFGAVYLASRKSVVGLCGITPVACGTFGVGLMAFAVSRTFWLSWLFMFIMGIATMVQMASGNTVVQTIVEDDKRGRVMSFFVMSFLGMTPFGSLIAGWLADRIGAPNTLVICGLLCVVGSFAYANRLPEIRRTIRPIYVKLGIVSE
jgi:MFS family permease